jgi:cytochrome P450/NADPH-cytochrome P450 reductase
VLRERAGRLPVYEDLPKLSYNMAVLKEALRLWPTAPMFAVTPLQETQVAESIPVKPGDVLMILLPELHRDPAVWGKDSDRFNPDNFLGEEARTRPPNAYRPFGHGPRGCIGRHFAMQEAVIALALILDRFALVDHAGYELKVQETLTLKPENFRIRVGRAQNSGQSP